MGRDDEESGPAYELCGRFLCTTDLPAIRSQMLRPDESGLSMTLTCENSLSC